MLKQALIPAAARFAAAATVVAAVGFSVIANTHSAEAASGRTVASMNEELVDIVEHGWRGPRHCHWRWRGRWVWICHRHW